MTEPAMLARFLANLASHPALLLGAIFVATLILEDAAIVAGGVLASRLAVDPVAAILVLMLGITAGDMALYGAGRWAGRSNWVRRQRARPALDRTLQWLERRWWLALVVARFTPGLRLPVYLSSGLLRLPPIACAAVVTAAGAVWTPGLFLLSRAGGAALGDAVIYGATAAVLTFAAIFAAGRALMARARLSLENYPRQLSLPPIRNQPERFSGF